MSRGRKLRESEPVELTLTGMAHRGPAVGRIDGQVVFAFYGIPGERVKVQLERRRKKFLHARVVEVLEASPDRTDPFCQYYGACGGCQWQHIEYAAQKRLKQQVVEEHFARIGKQAVGIDAVHTPQLPWEYRYGCEIALSREAGFRQRGSRRVVEIEHCAISHPLISKLLATLNAMIRDGRIPDLWGRNWVETRVIPQDSGAKLALILEGVRNVDLEAEPELGAVLEALATIPEAVSISYRTPSGRVEPFAGGALVGIELMGKTIQFPPGAFFQASVEMLPTAIARMRALAAIRSDETVLDLYCGVGIFGLFMAEDSGHVIGIEVDQQAIAAARQTAENWGMRNINFWDLPAEKVTEELPQVDIAVVDPPRTGMDPRVLRAVAGSAPSRIVYLSCEPSTLARDAGLLQEEGYRVERLELFDFFPQTYHIENLALFRRGEPS
ncbi:MAG: 23S rRNA (uracil(1939)-C(5))-methyltransferase RlmD [Chloroflexota bacterium]|nr:23S rRNA (uracil(1939)-C(5))-methyltransferase RlmD [Chloroflexota bacterium]MDE2841544.1 23S rRNA (uracil(1939)-C(5))-methyltransferase RlmD [Chloroflexota bacterium]